MNFQIPKIVHEEVDDHRGVFAIWKSISRVAKEIPSFRYFE